MIDCKDKDVRQLLDVHYIGGSEAEAKYYVKGRKGWRLRASGLAYVGKNGIGKTSEGDAKTPVGTLRAIKAFGILPNPGCSLPYLKVVPGTIAVDEEGPYYNHIVNTGPDGDFPPSARIPGGERMWELSPEYDYGLESDYNVAGIWPLGSAIFIHCKGAKKWTGGCVALDKRFMKKILLTADEGFRMLVR